jgi:hypothetical protein
MGCREELLVTLAARLCSEDVAGQPGSPTRSSDTSASRTGATPDTPWARITALSAAGSRPTRDEQVAAEPVAASMSSLDMRARLVVR